MKGKAAQIVRTVFIWVFAAYTFVTGALLVWQVTDLYFDGKHGGGVIYSRALVGERLSRLAPALWIWVALVVIGFGLGIAVVTKPRLAPADPRYTLARLRRRAGKAETPASAAALVRKEGSILRVLWMLVASVGIMGALYGLVYLAMPSHFAGEDVTAEMRAMVRHLAPWVSWTFLFAVGVTIYERFSVRKQLPAVKQMCKAGGGAAQDKPVRHAWDVWVVRGVVFAFSVACIVAGAVNGSARDVLVKAINICTECIGLG